MSSYISCRINSTVERGWSLYVLQVLTGARGSVVCLGTMLHAGRSRVRFPMREVNGFFQRPIPSSRTITLWSSQSLAEMSTRNLPEVYRAVGA
jgi:hypothetical protein